MFSILNESWSAPIIVDKTNIYEYIVAGMKADVIIDLQTCLGYLNAEHNSEFPDGTTISDINDEYDAVFDELRAQSNRADICACQGMTLVELVTALTPYKVYVDLTDLRDYKVALYGSLANWATVMQTAGIC